MGLTVAGVPSDCVHVAVTVMEEEFVLGPFGSALKQIHEVMAVDLPAVPQKQAAMQDTCGQRPKQHARNIRDDRQSWILLDLVGFQQPEIRIWLS